MPSSVFTIGEFARYSGINPKTIRYYEEIGLLPQPHRSQAGYRLYADEDLARLRFIQRAKLLGLSLAEVKQLADYANDRQCHSLQEHLLALVQEKSLEVDRRLAELAALRGDLHRFRDELAARVRETGAANACQCLMGQEEEGHAN